MSNNETTLKALDKFIHVVEELRSDHGCPWDRAQTHESLRMQLIQEAYEAAIKDKENIVKAVIKL